tara:strand:- start:586 stop:765 length:180 start_codon:yes stop_codon:yes gene_type:complete
MATINLTEGTVIQEEPQVIKLREIRLALSKLGGNDGCVQYNTEVIDELCKRLELLEQEI